MDIQNRTQNGTEKERNSLPNEFRKLSDLDIESCYCKVGRHITQKGKMTKLNAVATDIGTQGLLFSPYRMIQRDVGYMSLLK